MCQGRRETENHEQPLRGERSLEIVVPTSPFYSQEDDRLNDVSKITWQREGSQVLAPGLVPSPLHNAAREAPVARSFKLLPAPPTGRRSHAQSRSPCLPSPSNCW